ncbi:MAG: MATE family efflux transporter [archaeon]|nr:MATE family efflux transporter [archaeon]
MSETKDVQMLLGDPRKAIRSMVVPIAISFLIGQVNLFVDSIWCSSLGVDALSSISLVSSLFFLMIGVGNGIGVGLNVSVSRLIGAGETDAAGRRIPQILVMMTLVSVPLGILMYFLMEPIVVLMGGADILDGCREYLTPLFLCCIFPIMSGVLSGAMRGEGAAKKTSLINSVSAVVNMVMDPLLIFGLGMGLMGASAATMVSSAFSVCTMLYLYRSGKMFLPLRLKGFRFEADAIKDVLYVGLPQMLEMNVMSLLNLVLVSLVINCGGPEGLTVYNMPWRAISLVMVPAQAFASAMVPVCSAAIGQRNAEKLGQGYRYTVRSASVFGVGMAALMALASPLVVLAFTYGGGMEIYRDEMARVICIYALFMPFYGLISVGSSMLSAMKKSPYALLSAFLRNVLLICIFLIASTQNMDWFYWGLTVGEIIGGFMMMGLAHWQYRKTCVSIGGQGTGSPA